VASVVPTSEAKPHTIAGVNESRPSLDACTIAAPPTPTRIAAASGWPPSAAITSKVSDAIATPVKFEASERFQPWGPPPHAKNDAQAMKGTQTGSGTITAVMYVSSAPSTPMLMLIASACFTSNLLFAKVLLATFLHRD